jgi:hypothetical protein
MHSSNLQEFDRTRSQRGESTRTATFFSLLDNGPFPPRRTHNPKHKNIASTNKDGRRAGKARPSMHANGMRVIVIAMDMVLELEA